jgi:PRC-barrel domain
MPAVDQETLDRWRELVVVDRDGAAVGTISEFYLDRDSRQPTWALIDSGLLGHCCIEPECAGEGQQRGDSPSWKGAKKGSNHSTVPMICRL